MRMKRPFLALLAVLLCTAAATAQMGRRMRIQPVTGPALPPDIPSTQPDPDFPLKVRLFVARWNGYGSDYHGYGAGNLTEGADTHGFDYTYACSVPFQRSVDAGSLFQARWRKAPYQLEILLARVGGDREDVCTLKVAMREQAIDPASLRTTVNGPAPQPQGPRWLEPDAVFDEPDPDYPVRLHVISSARRDDISGARGWGTANLLEQPVRGVDYTFICDRGFLENTTATDFYQGHWVKPDQELEILTQRTGSDKVDKCRVGLTVRDTPYPDRATAPAQSQQPAMVRRDPTQP
jgi:hypothetical protein